MKSDEVYAVIALIVRNQEIYENDPVFDYEGQTLEQYVTRTRQCALDGIKSCLNELDH